MQLYEMERLLRNIDARITRIAQIFPTIPTRQELHDAIAAATSSLASKDDVRKGFAALATTDDRRGSFATPALNEEAPAAARMETAAWNVGDEPESGPNGGT